jgi:hypothetical protein
MVRLTVDQPVPGKFHDRVAQGREGQRLVDEHDDPDLIERPLRETVGRPDITISARYCENITSSFTASAAIK